MLRTLGARWSPGGVSGEAAGGGTSKASVRRRGIVGARSNEGALARASAAGFEGRAAGATNAPTSEVSISGAGALCAIGMPTRPGPGFRLALVGSELLGGAIPTF